jgi:hypothetical protein
MKLAATSTMVDAGTDVGLAFNGTAPDLGAFERPVIVPVQLLYFDCVLKNNTVLLNWKTATEINNKGWEVEKVFASSNNPFVWQKVGFVQAAVAGNLYSFTDDNVIKGNTYQYRLKQIDLDGTIKYSNIITIKVQKAGNIDLQVFPNPVKANTSMQFTVSVAGNVQVLLYNQQGQLIEKLLNENLQSGVYNRNFSLNKLTKGNYIIQLLTANQKVVKEVIKVD